MKIISPAQEGLVVGHDLLIEVAGARSAALAVRIDAREIDVEFVRMAYQGHYAATVDLEQAGVGVGRHTLRLADDGGAAQAHAFRNDVRDALEPAVLAAQGFIDEHPAGALGWNWGEAVFLYGLERLARVAPDPARQAFLDYLEAYFRRWDAGRIPRIRLPDRAAPGLPALAFHRYTGSAAPMPALDAAVEYVRTAPRTALGPINHQGTSFFSHVYPESIWVDSLMMYAVLAVAGGAWRGDAGLYDFGAQQPPIFAGKLQHPQTGLFRHAWLIKKQRRVPAARAFWLRGNGWAATSIVEMLDVIPDDEAARRQALLDVLTPLLRSAAERQMPNGLWDSILNDPGYTYAEASGSALLAYAMGKGVRRGYLPEALRAVAAKTYGALTASLVQAGAAYRVPRISGSTNALPKCFYRLVPRHTNRHYGVGAYLLLATEMYASVGTGP